MVERVSESSPLLSSSLTSSSSSTNLNRSGSRRPFVHTSINHDSYNEDSIRNAAVVSRYKYYCRLAAHPDNPMAIPDHVLPAELWTHVPVTSEGKQGSLVTIFSIWNTMMGTSLLSMPWAIEQAGFALGVFLLILMALLTLYTSYRVMNSVDTIASKAGQVLEFSDVCKEYLGRIGEISSVMFSFVALLGAAAVYWVLMSNFLYNIVCFIYAETKESIPSSRYNSSNSYHDPYINCTDENFLSGDDFSEISSLHSWNWEDLHNGTSVAPPNPSDVTFHNVWDLQKTVPFFLLVILVPLINFKSPTFLTKFNALGTISVVYLLGFVSYKTALWGFHMDFTQVPGYYARLSFPALTGVASLAFFIHSCILSIVRNQAKPEQNARDLTIAFICVTVTYCFAGGMFYAAWPMINKGCIDQNFLNNFLPGDTLAFVARIFLFVQMTTVYPLILYIMRVQVMHVIFGSIWPSWKHVAALNIGIVGICLIFARFLPKIGSIIRYTGAFCGLAYAFFLPATTYMLSEKNKGQLTRTKIVLHSVLIIAALANFIAQFLTSE
ncbi:neutral amino acid transporter 9-like [Watersipora subatra]|uniref:neutral amino acid transporter 9-like n=1 Tax=Watersipora subatra TaxID=2589382 RepID=UPI00355AEAEA